MNFKLRISLFAVCAALAGLNAWKAYDTNQQVNIVLSEVENVAEGEWFWSDILPGRNWNPTEVYIDCNTSKINVSVDVNFVVPGVWGSTNFNYEGANGNYTKKVIICGPGEGDCFFSGGC